MANFHNGVIRLPLRSAVCVHEDAPVRRLCLDSVLAGQFYERTGDGPGAIAWLPEIIEHWKFDSKTIIPKASQVIFLSPATIETPVLIYRSIFRTVLDPAIRHNIRDDKINWNNTTKTLESPHKAHMRNGYRAIDAQAIYYLFRGDVEAVEAAFRRVGRIGALRAKGGGEIDVDQITTDIVPESSEMFGIVCGDKLMRPIPERCKSALGNSVQYIQGSIETWHAPFHDAAGKEACLAPLQMGSQHQTMTTTQLVSLLT